MLPYLPFLCKKNDLSPWGGKGWERWWRGTQSVKRLLSGRLEAASIWVPSFLSQRWPLLPYIVLAEAWAVCQFLFSPRTWREVTIFKTNFTKNKRKITGEGKENTRSTNSPISCHRLPCLPCLPDSPGSLCLQSPLCLHPVFSLILPPCLQNMLLEPSSSLSPVAHPPLPRCISSVSGSEAEADGFPGGTAGGADLESCSRKEGFQMEGWRDRRQWAIFECHIVLAVWHIQPNLVLPYTAR